jgi:hypothetical protein
MGMPERERIFAVSGEKEFRELAMEIFLYQSTYNPVYKEYIRLLGISPAGVGVPEEIPFLPVEFFRDHRVLTGESEPELVFESSGTTSSRASRHYIADSTIYHESFTRGFRLQYGDPSDYCILALLPSYLERKNSSLVYMADGLIRLSGHPKSGFYLDNMDELETELRDLEKTGQQTLLFGVSFALADLARNHPLELHNTIIMETGGMKGRRKEMTRAELHDVLKKAFGVPSVHSEYGMTELLSQAYSTRDGIFQPPPWMRVLIRDPYDPLSPLERDSSGGINIIDLANLHSCSFIATQDIGKLVPGGGFEVLGRFDHSDVRGCNLMME